MKKILQMMLFSSLLIFTACASFAENGPPYQIKGEMVTEDSSDYENAGFDFSFYNKSEKRVKSFTIVFYLFDENGNPPLAGNNNIVLEIQDLIEPMDSTEMCISLDKYFSYIPENPYTVDFLYVSKIIYTDNSQWSDPFGMRSL